MKTADVVVVDSRGGEDGRHSGLEIVVVIKDGRCGVEMADMVVAGKDGRCGSVDSRRGSRRCGVSEIW